MFNVIVSESNNEDIIGPVYSIGEGKETISAHLLIHPNMRGSLLASRLCKQPETEPNNLLEQPAKLGTADTLFCAELAVESAHISSLSTVNLVVDTTFSPHSAKIGSACGIHPSEVARGSCGDPSCRLALTMGGTVALYTCKANTAVLQTSVGHAVTALMAKSVIDGHKPYLYKRACFATPRFLKMRVNMKPMRMRLRKKTPETIYDMAINQIVCAKRFPGVSYRVSVPITAPDGTTKTSTIPDKLTTVVVKHSHNTIVTGGPQSRKRLLGQIYYMFKNDSFRHVLGLSSRYDKQKTSTK
jgi:hypothetical protein